MCGGLPLSLQVLGRHVYKRDLRYWWEELEKVSKTLPGDIKETLKISFDSMDYEEKQIFMDVACFFVDKSTTIAMNIWEGSGWRSHHALEKLKDKCLVEDVKVKWLQCAALRMHDHLRDLGREMANEVSHPPRVWRPQHLKSLELKGFQNILAQTKGRCFHSIWDESMSCKISYFIGETEDSSDTSLLWLQLDYLDQPQLLPSIPECIPLQNLQCLIISGGFFQRLWQSDIQAPSRLKLLHINRTFLEEFPDLSGKSNNLKEIVLYAKEFQMDIWSILGSLGGNLRGLNVMGSKLTGELTSTDSAQGSSSNSLLIYDFKLEGEVALNNEGRSRTAVSDLEILDIKGSHLVTKLLITGNCCQRLHTIKICKMENLIEVELARIKTLNFLEITDCNKLKRLSLMPDLSKLVELKIDGCTELQELSFVHLSFLERIAIKKGKKLKSVSEIICNNIKLVELNISELDELQDSNCLSCLERIQIEKCSNLKRLSMIPDPTKLTQLYIKECSELEELPSLHRISCFKDFVIDHCEKLQSISGIEELHASEYMKHCYCGNAIIHNCFHKLKSEPREVHMIGRVVDGAESKLNLNLFMDTNTGINAVDLDSLWAYSDAVGSDSLRSLPFDIDSLWTYSDAVGSDSLRSPTFDLDSLWAY